MAVKKKKKILPLIALALVLGVLAGAYVILSRMDLNKDEPLVETPKITVIDKNASDAVELAYIKGNDSELSFTCESGTWYYDADRDFPLDQTKISSMVSAVSSVVASRELDGDSGEYGFDAPSLTVVVKYSDSTEYTVKLGNVNSFNSSTYLMLQNSKVYLFTDKLTSSFNYTFRDLIVLDEPGGDIDNNYLVSMTVRNADGAENTITDGNGMDDLLSTHNKTVDCEDWVQYAVTADELADYGITDSSARLMVNYKSAVAATDSDGNATTTRVPASYEVMFGGECEKDGENGEKIPCVYYTITDSTIVYRMEKTDCDKIMAYLEYTPDTTASDTEASPDTESAAE